MSIYLPNYSSVDKHVFWMQDTYGINDVSYPITQITKTTQATCYFLITAEQFWNRVSDRYDPVRQGFDYQSLCIISYKHQASALDCRADLTYRRSINQEIEKIFLHISKTFPTLEADTHQHLIFKIVTTAYQELKTQLEQEVEQLKIQVEELEQQNQQPESSEQKCTIC